MDVINRRMGGVYSLHDLRIYNRADSVFYGKQAGGLFSAAINALVTNPINSQWCIYKYVKHLRLSEYHLNNSILEGKRSIKAYMHTILLLYQYWRLRHYSYITGFQIPPKVCGPGLRIFHYGWIVVNEKSRIGSSLTIYPGVEIGHKSRGSGAPQIGDNCFIGAGAKIFGNIKIGDNVTIAPNAVVTKDVPDNCIVGGVPAKIIKMK